MKRKAKIDSVFTKSIPTCFIVQSSFQLLCALEAIQEFEIMRYKMIFAPHRWDTKRLKQMCNLANRFHVPYELIYVDDVEQFSLKCKQDKSIERKNTNKRFKRLFIGDSRVVKLHLIAIKYALPGSEILYLDDGAATLRVLLGIPDSEKYNWVLYFKWWKEVYLQKKKLYRFLKNRYDISVTNQYFSIFYNLKNSKCEVYPNTLIHVNKEFKNTKQRKGNVYVIGTVPNEFAENGGLTEDEFKEILKLNLYEIVSSNPNNHIVYIPHGRDTSLYVKNICAQYNIEYREVDECCEIYILQNDYPSAIYGYCSTSMMTLRILFPDCKIYNYFIARRTGNVRRQFFNALCSYYEDNAIKNIPIAQETITYKYYLQHIAYNINEIRNYLIHLYKNKIG